MIDLEEIEREINLLERRGDTTYSQCERLCWLYVVRDHLLPKDDDQKLRGLHGSEFLSLCDGKPYNTIMEIIDEHLEALRVVQPRAYEAVIDKIRSA